MFWCLPMVKLFLLIVALPSSEGLHKLCESDLCTVCSESTARCRTTSGQDLIPQDLRSTIRDLNVSHVATENTTAEITRKMFERYPDLQILRLHGNFHSIQEDALSNLKQLERLNIVRTNITVIPPNLLQNNIKIWSVKFNGNLIQHVPFDAIGKDNNLTVLHFKGNRVPVTFPCTEITSSENNSYVRLPDIVEDFKHLTNLSLTGLEINTTDCTSNKITANFLEPLSNTLTALDVSESDLQLYDSKIFSSLEELESLTLADVSPFRACPASANKSLENLPNSVKSLQLTYWENIDERNYTCFLNASTLSGLYNHTSLTSLSFIYSDYAFGSYLADHSLPLMPSLRYLDLGFCRISFLTAKSLFNVSSLEVLKLDGNPIGQQIYYFHIENPPINLPSVTVLSLQKTGIRSDSRTRFNLEPITRFFDNVSKIDLSQNDLTQLPVYVPDNGTKTPSLNVTHLIMDHNELTAFSNYEDVCAQFPALTSLSLAHNMLESIDGLCPGLFELDLSYNKLVSDTITLTIIKNQTSLEFLDLTNNYTPKLPSALLSGMPNLTVFRAADTQLTEIHGDFFHNNTRLEIIDLSVNFISNISPLMFSSLPNLSKLFLHANHISTFTESFTEYIEDSNSLEMIDLQDNPIDCRCSQDYFKNWLRTTKKLQNIKKLQCSTPPYLVDEYAYNYVVNHFECVVKTPLLHTIFVMLGILLALLFALPCYKYRWYIKHAKVVYRAIKDSLNSVKIEHNCEYDAYVSYNRADADDARWVENSLIPAVEQPRDRDGQMLGGQLPRMYVEERDALIGVPRFTERANALKKSRKILIVVSNSYLSSAYCLGEADLSGYEMYGTEFYQPNRILVLVREDLREEIIKAPMTALLVGNVINVDCVGKKQINMWKRIQNFVRTPQFYYRKLERKPERKPECETARQLERGSRVTALEMQ